VALAERMGARVITDLKPGAVFPTDHPLHAGMPAVWLDADAGAALRGADVILSLDWVDLGGAIKAVFGTAGPPAKVIHASLDHRLHGGWSMDYQAPPPVDMQKGRGARCRRRRAARCAPRAPPNPAGRARSRRGRSTGHARYRAGSIPPPRRGGTRGPSSTCRSWDGAGRSGVRSTHRLDGGGGTRGPRHSVGAALPCATEDACPSASAATAIS
jgi:hypothetical protein